MTRNEQAGSQAERKRGTPGKFSRWMQHRMNARTNRKIRRGRGTFMGMDLLILHTEGRRSGQPRETPVAWFADAADGEDGEDARLIVASGGGSQHPDWYVNLMAHADREQAWQRIAVAQPRIAKYQGKSDREYPVVRLTVR
jgi:hypothetical protein